jgi:hypothetical protein
VLPAWRGSGTGRVADCAVTLAGIASLEIGALFSDAEDCVILGFPLLMVVGMLAGLGSRAYRAKEEQPSTCWGKPRNGANISTRPPSWVNEPASPGRSTTYWPTP